MQKLNYMPGLRKFPGGKSDLLRYFAGIDHDVFMDELYKLQQRGISFIVSYDGKCGEKKYGKLLPEKIGLKHVQINAGRSTQAALLGKDAITYESLYLTRNLSLLNNENGIWSTSNELSSRVS